MAKRKLTHEQKTSITEATIKELAKRAFVESDTSLEEITEHVNTQYNRSYEVKTIHAWCYAEHWDEAREERKVKEKALPEKIGMANVRKEADKRDYDRLTELIDIMEREFEVAPDAKVLTALVNAYKFKRDLRSSAIVDDDHNEIVMLLANANKEMLQLEQNKTIEVEVSGDSNN